MDDPLTLRALQPVDVTADYVNWMNDEDVVCYTEQRWRKHTQEEVCAFVQEKLESKREHLLGIFLGQRHVGNVKIGPVNAAHNTADISYIIGIKDLWGRGLGSEAIAQACRYAFDVLNIRKLTAGVYANNIGSCKALEKNGFQKEGVRKKQYLWQDEEYVDGILYGLFPE